MIYLRAHHILCILQFRGYGYSDEFIKNMQNIMNRLKIEPIIIIEDFDDICISCPNKSKNICLLDTNIKCLDKNVLEKLSLPINTPIYFKELLPILEKTISKDIFNSICGKCTWHKNNVCLYNNFNFNILN